MRKSYLFLIRSVLLITVLSLFNCTFCLAQSELSGTKTVGSGGDYTTLTEVFDSINVSILIDTLKLVLIDESYHEPQLYLEPDSSVGKPLIITSTSGLFMNKNFITSNKKVININRVDPLNDIGLHIMNAPHVLFENIRFILDPIDTFAVVVKAEGVCPGLTFNNVTIDGGDAYFGIELLGDSSNLEARDDSIFNVINGIYATGWSSLAVVNSVISHEAEIGIYIDGLWGGDIRIDSNTINGNDASDYCIAGYAEGPSLSIRDNNLIGFTGGGVILDGFNGTESSILKSKASQMKKSMSSTGELRAEIKRKITKWKNRVHSNSMEQLKQEWTERRGELSKTTHHSLNYLTLPTVTISGNTVIPESEASTGIFINSITGPVSMVEINLNVIRQVFDNGIMMETAEISQEGSLTVRDNDIEIWGGTGLRLSEVEEPLVVDINKNNIRAVEPVTAELKPRKTKTNYSSPVYIIGEEGIAIFTSSWAEGSTVTVDSNTVSGFYGWGIHSQIFATGAISVSDNILTDGGIRIEEVHGQNLNIDRNHIYEFSEAGIQWDGFILYNPEVVGGMSVSNNTIIGSDSSGGFIAIYGVGVEAYTLAVDDNNISGNYFGDGIMVEYFYSPEPYTGLMKLKAEKAIAVVSLKERLMNLKTKMKNRYRAMQREEMKKKWAERKNSQNQEVKLTKTGTSNSYLSMQRNDMNWKGGGTGGIYIQNCRGPLTVKVNDNSVIPVEGADNGIYIGEIGELGEIDRAASKVELERNMVRNASSLGIGIDGMCITQVGSLIVRENDIEIVVGDIGLFLGEVQEPLIIDVEKNNIRAVESITAGSKQRVKKFNYPIPNGGEGLTFYAYSDLHISGRSAVIDSNQVENFVYGMNLQFYDLSNFELSNNVIQNNENGIYLEGVGRIFQSGSITGNKIQDNGWGGELVFEGSVSIRFNSIINNDSVGLRISASPAAPIIQYNNLYGSKKNTLINDFKTYIDARYNWWGEATTAEMDAGPYPKNISMIWDQFDNPGLGFIEYGEWRHSAIGTSHGKITGTKFNDLDGDGIFDPEENGLEGWIIHLSPYDLYATTDENGNFVFDYLPAGAYTLNELPKQYWQQTCPPSPGTIEVTLTEGEIATDKDFGNQIIPNIKDLHISVAGGIARPGFVKYYGIRYGNKGTESVNSTVAFTHPENTTYLSGWSSPPHTSYDAPTRTVTWDVGAVSPSGVGFIHLAVQIAPPPDVNIGDVLTSCARIKPVAGDENPLDNEECESQTVQGSFDPNDKLVTPEGFISAATELTYLIRFQNTGNDTAFNVVVRDTLDSGLDPSTLELGASSHPYTFELSGERQLTFRFNNIQLPDSFINEPSSHGFLSYKVKPWSDGRDTVIENAANIYFDFNLPVRTNKVTSYIGVMIALNVDGRWNMVSVPIYPDNYGKNVIFPTAITPAYTYEDIYVKKDVLENGRGYWMKFASSQIVEMFGVAYTKDTVDVSSGWNMIGSISDPIVTASITSDPPGIITSEFFTYSGSYMPTDSIEPGRGYWVKVNQAGKLILSSSGVVSSFAKIRIVPTSEQPPHPPEELIFNTKLPIPNQYALEQNFPNPFNPVTTLKYDLPLTSNVKLKIYNTLGRLVTVLVDEIQEAGYKSVNWNSSNIASGVYFYRLEATSLYDPSKMFMQVRKMLLVR